MGKKFVIAGREVEVENLACTEQGVSFSIAGKAYCFGKAELQKVEVARAGVGKPWQVLLPFGDVWVEEAGGRKRGGGEAGSDGVIRAPMPGQVVSVAVKEGQKVAKGEALLVVEAMKLQLTLAAPFDGKVTAVKALAKDQVQEGQELAVVAKVE
ncbi:MAG: biotin/lipoyl-binding protein [Alphaproteobacteria bacterium]|nr:biotin/lipoyl-binding protein [Alphaproteobacteria bacterium]